MKRLVAAAAAAALNLTACSLGAQPPDLVVGAVYPLSGSQADGGRQELAGVQAALRLAEQSGALHGRHVRLQVIDARSPQGAADAVDRLVDQYRVPAVVGTYGSTLAVAAAARADQRHVFYLETGAVADEVTLGHRWVFRTVASGASLGRIAVDFTADRLLPAPGQARAVIVHVDDVYGRSVMDGEAAEAGHRGIQVSDNIAYDPLNYDAAAIASRVGAARADYLWDVSYLDDGVAIWHALAAARAPLRAAVGTSSAFCMPQFGSRLGAEAVGVFAADKPDDAVSKSALNPEARALLVRAQQAYESPMTIPAVAGFVGGWAFFHDILPVPGGEVTSDALRSAAHRLDVPTGAAINGGGVRFPPDGDSDSGQNLRAAAVVGQWQSGVVMKVVYPPAYAQAAPVIPPAPSASS